MVKKYISNGGRITIEIDNGNLKTPDSKLRTGSKGLIKTRRRNDYLPRRKKGGGFINFYDLGKLNGGASVYKYYQLNITNGDGTIPGAEIEFSFEPVTQTMLDSLQTQISNEIFSHTLNDFEKITPDSDAARFVLIGQNETGTSVYETLFDSELFTSDGLKITDFDEFRIFPSEPVFMFNGLSTLSSPGAGYKTTAINSPSAPSVSFSPSAKMDVFLMPLICYNSSQIQYRNGFHSIPEKSERIKVVELLNGNISTFPREFLSDFVTANESEDSYIQNYKLMQIYNKFGGARFRKATRDFSEIYPYYFYVNYENGLDPLNFPYSVIYTPTGTVTGSGVIADGFFFMNIITRGEGERLVFIVRQNNNLFYFWQTGN